MNQAVLFIVVVVFAGGSFVMALKDPEFRPVFADLAKVGISGFFGSLMPGLGSMPIGSIPGLTGSKGHKKSGVAE